MDDETLLQAWATGDEAAGVALYRRHFAALYRFFRTRAPHDFEDLIQTTMLECVRSKDRYRGESPFVGFLFGLARNCLLHHYRSRSRDRLDFDASHGEVADLDLRPSTIFARKAEHARLHAAMARIPLELRLVLELHYWESLSTRELAETIAVPQGTVKSRLRRGREALREALAAVAPPGASPGREDPG
jgi:RNA polymerase sigma factor (sigma-70 family)